MSYSVLGRDSNHPYYDEVIPHKVTMQMMRENKTFIKAYDNWLLAKAKPEYKHTKEHLILWNERSGQRQHMQCHIPEWSELRRLLDKYNKQGYTIVINPPQEKSIPNQQHIHLLKFNKFETIEGVDVKESNDQE